MTEMRPGAVRVLAIHRYFWPDLAPYGVILRGIVRQWADDGHDVSVLTCQPSYRAEQPSRRLGKIENDDGVRVHRKNLPAEAGRGTATRSLIVLMWAAAIILFVLRNKRFDVIMIGTTPPVLAAAAARLAAGLKNSKLVYHCMDIHPEIGRLSGEFSNQRIFRFLQRIDTKNCNGAAKVVVLSDDMASALSGRRKARNVQISVINNYNTADAPSAHAQSGLIPNNDPERTRIIFTGNMGRFQGLGHVSDALRSLPPDTRYEIYFVGGGVMIDSMKQALADYLGRSVHFLPYQPAEDARYMIRQSDFGLVSLEPQVAMFAYPSKTMTYLAEGRPIIACVEADSSLARLLVDNEIGVVSPPANAAALAQNIAALAADPERCRRMKQNAADIGPNLFEREKIMAEWSRLLTAL